MFPQEWSPILKSMVRIYPEACNLRLIGGSTDLDDQTLKRTVRDLTARGFIVFDASDKDGRMLRLSEAGMALACDRAAKADAPKLLDELETGALQAMMRCREHRGAAARLN